MRTHLQLSLELTLQQSSLNGAIDIHIILVLSLTATGSQQTAALKSMMLKNRGLIKRILLILYMVEISSSPSTTGQS